jgi:hypothetical protein
MYTAVTVVWTSSYGTATGTDVARSGAGQFGHIIS